MSVSRPRALAAFLLIGCLPGVASAQAWPSSDLDSGGTEVFCLASGDVDADLRVDLVAGTQDSTVLVYRHGADGLALTQTIQLADDPMALDVSDLDGDGDLDIIFGTRGTVSGGWIPNQGDGTFGQPIIVFSPLAHPRRVSATDVDGDLDRDLVYLEHSGNQSLMVVYNDGGGVFSSFEVLGEGVVSYAFQGYSANPPAPLFTYATTDGRLRIGEGGGDVEDQLTMVQYPAVAWGGIVDNDATFDVVAWSTLASAQPAPTLIESTDPGDLTSFPDVGGTIVPGNALSAVRYSGADGLDFLEADTAGGVVRGWRLSGGQLVGEVLADGTSQGNGWATVHMADVDGDCDLDLVRDDFAPSERIVIGWNPLDIGDSDGDGVGVCGGDCDDADPSLGYIGDDADCDGALTAEDCDDEDPDSPTRSDDGDCDGIPTAEDCDDADPESNAIFQDRDCDGALSADDCDDLDPLALPGGIETCDGVDNDCDGAVDQGLDCGAGDDDDDDDLPIPGCCAQEGVSTSWVGLLALGMLGRRRRDPTA